MNRRAALCRFSIACVALLSSAVNVRAADPEWVSVPAAGAETGPGVHSGSSQPALSGDGRYVAFISGSPHLVEGDTNGKRDIFVRDRLLGRTTRVSVSSTGQQGDNHSAVTTISADGRYVAFDSVASNLVPGDTNSWDDVFVHDQLTGTTIRVSVAGDGTQLAGGGRWARISSTGRYVAFSTQTFATARLAVHDRDADGDGLFDEPGAISTRLLTFSSTLIRSTSSIGEPAISDDGRFLAAQVHGTFSDGAWTRVLLHDRDPDGNGVFDEAGAILTLNVSGMYADTPRLTADGRYLVFSGHSPLVSDDTNGIADVFVYDRVTASTRRVSVHSGGAQGFDDQQRGSLSPAMSASGRFITFVSYSLRVPGDLVDTGHLVVHDRDADADGNFDEAGEVETRRVSGGPEGEEWNDGVEFPDISADGRYVAFGSPASDIVNGDTNGGFDVFLVDLNRAPVAGAIVPASTLLPLFTRVAAVASFVDADRGDTHSAVWNWGDGTTSAALLTEAGGTGTISGTHEYAAAGVYTVTLTLVDDRGASSTSRYEYIVAYDAAGGFVTGNGLITSPAGAFRTDPTLAGTARVSFVSKYQKGANEPVGNTNFDFRVAGLSFQSESYAWLVVAGARAQLKGTGSINGAGGYGFMLSAVDGDLASGGGGDRVRVKIWELVSGAVVYDSQFGDGDDALAATDIRNGSIVIHK